MKPYVDWAVFCRRVTKQGAEFTLHNILTIISCPEGEIPVCLVTSMRARPNSDTTITIAYQAPSGAATTQGPLPLGFGPTGVCTFATEVKIPALVPGTVSAHFLFEGETEPDHVALFQIVEIERGLSPAASKPMH